MSSLDLFRRMACSLPCQRVLNTALGGMLLTSIHMHSATRAAFLADDEPAEVAQTGNEPLFEGRPFDEWIEQLLHSNDMPLRHQSVRALTHFIDRAVPRLERELKEGDDTVARTWAAFALGSIGAPSKVALPTLREALSDKNIYVRIYASQAIWKATREGDAIMPVLLKCLDDANIQVVAATVQVLTEVGDSGKAALSQLLKLQLQGSLNELAQLNSAIVAYAVKLGPLAVGPLIDALRQKSFFAENALGQLGPLAVPEVMECLNSDDAFVRSAACRILAQVGGNARPAVGALAQALEDKEPLVRSLAATALWKIDRSEAAVTFFVTAVKDEDDRLRRPVLVSIGDLGPRAMDAVTPLEALLISPNKSYAALAAIALWKIAAQVHLRELIAVFDDADVLLATVAIDTVGAMKERAGAAADPLVKCLERDDFRSYNASVALGMLDSAAIPALKRALEHQNAKVRLQALDALGRMQPVSAALALSDIDRATRDHDDAVKQRANQVLIHLPSPARVQGWIEAIKSGSEQERISALDGLRELGPDAKSAAPDLIAALDDEDGTIRKLAIGVLTRIGAAAIPELTVGLRSSSSRVRAAALQAISDLEPDDQKNAMLLTPDIIALCGDPDQGVSANAKEAVIQLGGTDQRALPIYVEVLNDEVRPSYLRAAAARTLGKFGADGLKTLTPALAFDDDTIRIGVVEGIAELGQRAKMTVPELLKLLDVKSVRVRYAVANALANIHIDANAVPMVVERLGFYRNAPTDDSQWEERFREWIVRSLATAGPHAASAVELLRELLKDDASNVKEAVIEALGQIGPASNSAIDDLLAALSSSSKSNAATRRVEIVQALARIDLDGERLVPTCLDILRDKEADPILRQGVSNILTTTAAATGRLQKQLRPHLQDLISWLDDEAISSLSMVVISAMGADAKPAVPKLTEALNRGGPNSQFAVYALGQIGAEARAAVPDLLRLLETSDDSERVSIVLALRQIGVNEPRDLPLVIKALELTDPRVQLWAAQTLEWYGSEAKDSTGALASRLAASTVDVRRAVSRTLQLIGPGAAAIVPTLQSALHDEDEIVRANSAAALGKIGKSAAPATDDLLSVLRSDPYFDARASAAFAIGQIQAKPETAIPELVKALQRADENAQARDIVGEALANFGSASVADLVATLKDSTAAPIALRALSNIGPNASSAIPALAGAVVGDETHDRLATAVCLAKVVTGMTDDDTQYLRDLRSALPRLNAMRTAADNPQRFQTEVIAPINSAYSRLWWIRWRPIIYGFAIGGPLFAIFIALLIFRTSMVYAIRGALGAHWQTSAQPLTGWQLRITDLGGDHVNVELTPQLQGARGFSNKVAFPSEHRQRIAEIRMQLYSAADNFDKKDAEAVKKALVAYQTNLAEILDPTNSFRPMLAGPEPEVEFILDVSFQDDLVEALLVPFPDTVERPIGLNKGISRLQLGTAAAAGRPLHPSRKLSALIIGNPRGDLTAATMEANSIERRLRLVGIDVHVLLKEEATFDRMKSVLAAQSTPWMLHYAGHVGYCKMDNQWKCLLNGADVAAKDFVDCVCHNNVILAFINGCGSFGNNDGQVSAAGFGRLFLQENVPFIGTHFPVRDLAAMDFANSFYNAFLPPRGTSRGQPFGTAALAARQSIETGNWFNYVAYGKPGFTLGFHRLQHAQL